MSVNNINQQGVFIGPGSAPSTTTAIESVNMESLVYGGQLGVKVKLADKRYQLVKVDSGATAAADVAPAASLLAYWKDKEAFLVTTDRAQTEDGGNNYNNVAGIFTYAATPGYYTFIHKEGKRDVKTASGGTAPSVGGMAYAYAGAGAVANCTAIGGTAPIYPPWGRYCEAGSAGDTVEVDVKVLD